MECGHRTSLDLPMNTSCLYRHRVLWLPGDANLCGLGVSQIEQTFGSESLVLTSLGGSTQQLSAIRALC
jgi:hypothetical protein